MTNDIAKQLRRAIKRSRISANKLGAESGVAQTTISRFLSGKDMGIHKAAKIAKVLSLELKRKRESKGRVGFDL